MRMPAVGELFEGAYLIEAVLGEGGFARVYRGVDQIAKRHVAIKVLQPDGERGYEPDVVARFEREVQIVAQLRDPHTVRMFGHGHTASGLMYMVFELVEGRDLSEVLAEVGTLGEDAVIHVLTQVLFALREAHALGLLHRDLKPSNIRVFDFMGDPLCVKLLDFGIARPVSKDAGPQITTKGEILGTPRYMSPEQLRFQDLTPASDIYSLGVVAYEMLVGTAHMHGTRLTDQIDRVAFTNVLALPDTTAASLRAVVDRMLERSIERRYQNANEVLSALGVTLPALSQPTAVLEAVRRTDAPISIRDATTKRLREIKRAIAVGLVAVFGVVVTVIIARSEDRTAPPPTPTQRAANVLVKGLAPHPPPAEAKPTREPIVDVAALDAGTEVDFGPLPAATGCGKPPPIKGQRDRFLGSNGQEILVRIPPKYDRNHPYSVVALFHDRHQTAHEGATAADLDKDFIPRGYIVVAPRALQMFGWSGAGAAIVDAALQDVAAHFCIDRDRVFLVGVGQGGRVVDEAACFSRGIVAVATVGYRDPPACSTPPIPHITFTGREDQALPLVGGDCGGVSVISLADFEEAWHSRNSCPGAQGSWEDARDGACHASPCETPFVSCVLDGGRGFPKSKPYRGGWDRLPLTSCPTGPAPTFDISPRLLRFFESIR